MSSIPQYGNRPSMECLSLTGRSEWHTTYELRAPQAGARTSATAAEEYCRQLVLFIKN